MPAIAKAITVNKRRSGRRKVNSTAFSLVELLAALFIIAMLLVFAVPSLVRARQKMDTVLCANQGRAIATDFQIFADEYARGWRGDSEELGNRFDALDFLEKQYYVGEFAKNENEEFEEYERGTMQLICPSVKQGLGRLPNRQKPYKPAVHPRGKVSYAMNRRLFMAPVTRPSGAIWERPVALSERVLTDPYVPLMFDVDAQAAMDSVGHMEFTYLPFFSAPYLPGDEYWFPAKRHQGKINIVFIGGHVVTTKDPLKGREESWKWHPPVEPQMETGMR